MNGRYDGTSRFPKEKRFGFFPSASAAWRVDAEPFFESFLSTVSQLKVRASYGSLGNQLVGEYGYIPAMSSQLGNYIINGKLQQVVTPPSLVSPDYTWEEVRTLNGGLDLAFLDNKLTATVDVYRRDTKGMLTLGKELPGVLGASEPKENAADMKTTGWELTVGYRDRSTGVSNSCSRITVRGLPGSTTRTGALPNITKDRNWAKYGDCKAMVSSRVKMKSRTSTSRPSSPGVLWKSSTDGRNIRT